MYTDIISYKLAEGVSEEHLLEVAGKIIEGWMRKLNGFIKWEIHKNTDGSFTDVVYWESKEDAKKAEGEMANIPNAMDWYGCYDRDSIDCKNLNLLN